jgi:cyanophycin synthetase
MRIIEQRFLRGPNLFAATPCLSAVVDIEDTQVPDSAPACSNNCPACRPEASARLSDCSSPGRSAGAGRDGTAAPGRRARQLQPDHRQAGKAGQLRVVCGYALEQVAGAALRTAQDLIGALAAHAAFDLEAALDELKDIARRYAIGTSTGAVIHAAHKRGIPSLRLTDEANLFQLGWGSKQKRLQATITGATNNIAVGIASDKQLTKTLLDQAGCPVPAGETVTTLAAAQRIARRLGTVTIKPLDANQGKGVTTACSTPEDVERAFEFARKYGRHVIVEEFLRGRDYRVLVTGRKVAAASWRRPPHVTGDGVHTIRQLVEIENRNPARGDGHTNILTKIPLDDIALQVLASQGYSSTPCRPKANRSTCAATPTCPPAAPPKT